MSQRYDTPPDGQVILCGKNGCEVMPTSSERTRYALAERERLFLEWMQVIGEEPDPEQQITWFVEAEDAYDRRSAIMVQPGASPTESQKK
jgi:hypothetical protein